MVRMVGTRERRRRGLAMWLPLAGCVGVSFPRFLLDSTDSIQPASLPWAALMTAWWCLPLVWLLRSARSAAVAWVGSLIYLVFAAFSQAAAYRDTHSTAIFGVAFWPPYLAAGIAVLLGLEALAVRLKRGDS
jgi:hypothetical protein